MNTLSFFKPISGLFFAVLWLLCAECSSYRKFYGQEEVLSARSRLPNTTFESSRWYDNGNIFALRVHAQTDVPLKGAKERCRANLAEIAGGQIVAFFNGIRIDSTRPDPEYKFDKMIAIAQASGILRHIELSDFKESADKKDFGCSSLAVVYWPGLKTKLLNGEFLFQN